MIEIIAITILTLWSAFLTYCVSELSEDNRRLLDKTEFTKTQIADVSKAVHLLEQNTVVIPGTGYSLLKTFTTEKRIGKVLKAVLDHLNLEVTNVPETQAQVTVTKRDKTK